MLARLARIAALLFALLVIVAVGAGVAGLYMFERFGADLPEVGQLADYQPPTVSRIHAGDGRLLAEYAREKRVFVPAEAIPTRLKEAFIAAEDQNFYRHPGIDVVGIVRTAITNIDRMRNNRRPAGASTITQQVAKNFLLTGEVSLGRKVKEAILALRIERAFTKDKILELYMNQIFLGERSYGVAAAALNYFDKSLDDLSLGQAAFLAGLPKAPSTYDPTKNPQEARTRRDYVLGRMLEDGYITKQEAEIARAEPLVTVKRSATQFASADFFTEEVRRQLVARFGEEGFLEGGLSVRTTVLPKLQALTDRALRSGLVNYDRRQGWVGTTMVFDPATMGADWRQALSGWDPGFELVSWQRAVVLEITDKAARIGLENGDEGTIPLSELTWARARQPDDSVGPEVKRASQVLKPNDMILVEAVPVDPKKPAPEGQVFYALRQRPSIEGAVVAMDPHDGRVLAMSGGFSYRQSQFNRATQAQRQPGSSFKPFVYMAALEKGHPPNEIILDAPIVLDQGADLGKWKPGNYGDKFYGPSTMRLGLEQSRNLMTVRLAQEVGMDAVTDTAHRFGLDRRETEMNLSAALGSAETDLLTLTTAYSMIVNGGREIAPALIERIQDRNGQTVMRRDGRTCEGCKLASWAAGDLPPDQPDKRAQIEDPRVAYQMVSMMEGVIQRGTGHEAAKLDRPLAGKTGTTNESRDVWFLGFSPDLVVGVFIGYDQPKGLGEKETGAKAALPIWIQVMGEWLADQPPLPFRVPPGISLVRVDAKTGLLPDKGAKNVILEAFIPGTEPVRGAVTAGGGGGSGGAKAGSPDGDGLY